MSQIKIRAMLLGNEKELQGANELLEFLTIEVFNDFEQGIKMLHENAKSYQLVIVDLMDLPLHYLKALSSLKNKNEKIIVMFLSVFELIRNLLESELGRDICEVTQNENGAVTLNCPVKKRIDTLSSKIGLDYTSGVSFKNRQTTHN